ncbi:hypothetical protein AVEN_193571-1, partial [Araneus ventricosus]
VGLSPGDTSDMGMRCCRIRSKLSLPCWIQKWCGTELPPCRWRVEPLSEKSSHVPSVIRAIMRRSQCPNCDSQRPGHSVHPGCFGRAELILLW